jgi:hypothetical protein
LLSPHAIGVDLGCCYKELYEHESVNTLTLQLDDDNRQNRRVVFAHLFKAVN